MPSKNKDVSKKQIEWEKKQEEAAKKQQEKMTEKKKEEAAAEPEYDISEIPKNWPDDIVNHLLLDRNLPVLAY